jgi:hypothetical protein
MKFDLFCSRRTQRVALTAVSDAVYFAIKAPTSVWQTLPPTQPEERGRIVHRNVGITSQTAIIFIGKSGLNPREHCWLT